MFYEYEKSSCHLLTPETWTVIMMAVAFLLAVYITVKYKKPVFAAVVTWALAGIYLRWETSEYTLISLAAIVMATLTGALFVYSVIRKETRTITA